MSVPRQFSRFLAIGGACTALHYLILLVSVRSGLSGPVSASAAGFFLSAILNYILNRTVTFSSKRAHIDAAPRFFVVAVSGLAINTAVLGFFNAIVGWHYLVAQIFATCATMVWNFTLHRIWTFSQSKEDTNFPGGAA